MRWRYGRVLSYQNLGVERFGPRRVAINKGARIVLTDTNAHPRSVKHTFNISVPAAKGKRFKRGDVVKYTVKNNVIDLIERVEE